MNEEMPASAPDWDESPDIPLLDAPRSVTEAPVSAVATPVQTADPAPGPGEPPAASAPDEDDEDDASIQRKYRGKSAYGRIKELASQRKALKAERETLAAESTRLKARIAEMEAATRSVPPRDAPSRTPTPTPTAAAGTRAGAPTGSDDPEPDPSDEQKYPDGVYTPQFYKDHSRWAAREELRQHTQRQQQDANRRAVQESWTRRTTAAKAKYPDFEAVAYAPTPIEAGSPIDLFIMEDDAGADVLYHLHKHPVELSALLSLPVLGQLKALSLLSQRVSSVPTRQAGERTGAPPAPATTKVSRPPTPVRTGPVSAASGVPDADSDDLDAHMKHYYPKGRQRVSRAG